MINLHVPGFPRIGAHRELKFALERFWRGEIPASELISVGASLRRHHWAMQRDAGLTSVTVGDFAFYDHVLDLVETFGCAPARFGFTGEETSLERQFAMARGTHTEPAMQLTKWFDTNYHYLVPEFVPDMSFRLDASRLLTQVAEAQELGHQVKVTLVGPLTFLWLGTEKENGFSRLQLWEELVTVYRQLLGHLAEVGVEWVQLDEPILSLELSTEWRSTFEPVYARLMGAGPKVMVASYFGALGANLVTTCQLPVHALHVDLVRHPEELVRILDWLPVSKCLSAGVVDGRNVWRTDLDTTLADLRLARERLGERLWLSTSCSLLHVPLDVTQEMRLDPQRRSWLAFARQKLEELALLGRALDAGEDAVAGALADAREALQARRTSVRVVNVDVRERVENLPVDADRRALSYARRRGGQRARLDLPLLPTTTVGSFPQTPEIRTARAAYRNGQLSEAEYVARMRLEVARVIREQESLGLDVLVHGEAERSDLAEYFAGQLDGILITDNGWVQSFGNCCVKPPVIYGDVVRRGPMTVTWTAYAQGLTRRPVKGILTGPVTLLHRSFVRDDLSQPDICLQIALAIRDEVRDLERAGIRVIQIDEPALREGLPLGPTERAAYLEWATRAFRIAAGGAGGTTQIHTHMCYSEVGDILPAIAAMDADVITIESSRSQMALLDALGDFRYPNEIGPGIYDVHAPRVPSVEEMVELLETAVAVIPAERLWVNPDCGLKAREWPEIRAALSNMVKATHIMRQRMGIQGSVQQGTQNVG